MANWNKMMEAFGNAVGRKVGKPNKTSEMISDIGRKGDSEEFINGERAGQFLKNKATDIEYDKMYGRLDDNARSVFDAYNLDDERSYGPNGAYRMAIERAGVDPNEVPYDIDSWRETFGFDISEPAPRSMNVARRAERLADERTDEALPDDFAKEFKRAEDKAKYGNRMRELRDADITDERVAEDIGEMSDASVREEMIRRLLDENQDISDVLRWADDLYNKYK